MWTPYIGEQLSCAVDSGNSEDPYAVAVQKDGETIGHVPRTISCGVGGVGVNCGNRNPKKSRLQTVNGNGLSLTVDLGGVVLLWTGWMLGCAFDGAFEDRKRAIMRWL